MEPTSHARKGRKGSLDQPRGHRERPGPRHPDPRARVRRLRQRGGEVPGRRDRGERVHRLPPEAGRVRPAPGRRADDPDQAADGRHHARAVGDVRGRHRGVRAAEQVAHHHAPEHPDPPHPAAPRGRADPQDLRLRAVLARGLRQHRPQRDRRPLRRRLRRRALRHHPVGGRVRALLRAPPHHPADAAQGQDGVHRLRRRPRDHRHPRHRLHPARARRREGRRGPRGRRHVDHAARRPHAVRLRGARQRRLPEGLGGRLPDLRPPGLAAREPRPRADQGADRQDRHRRVPRAGGGGAQGRLGRTSATSTPRRCC